MSKITHIIATKFGGEWDIRAMRDDFQEIKTNVKDEFKENFESFVNSLEEIKTEKEIENEMKNELLSKITENLSDEEKYKNLKFYDKWKDRKRYKIGSIVKQFVANEEFLFRCKKEHESDYGIMPTLSAEHWEKIPNGKEEPRNPLLPKSKPDLYNNEKTYKKGTELESDRYCIFNDKVYEYVGDEPADGKSPFSYPQLWKEIGKWQD